MLTDTVSGTSVAVSMVNIGESVKKALDYLLTPAPFFLHGGIVAAGLYFIVDIGVVAHNAVARTAYDDDMRQFRNELVAIVDGTNSKLITIADRTSDKVEQSNIRVDNKFEDRFSNLKSEFKSEVRKDIQDEFKTVRKEVKGDFNSMKSELKKELKDELKSEIKNELKSFQRNFFEEMKTYRRD